MKKYNKPQVIAKNLPSGSYAAGCPANTTYKQLCLIMSAHSYCKSCERSQ